MQLNGLQFNANVEHGLFSRCQNQMSNYNNRTHGGMNGVRVYPFVESIQLICSDERRFMKSLAYRTFFIRVYDAFHLCMQFIFHKRVRRKAATAATASL